MTGYLDQAFDWYVGDMGRIDAWAEVNDITVVAPADWLVKGNTGAYLQVHSLGSKPAAEYLLADISSQPVRGRVTESAPIVAHHVLSTGASQAGLQLSASHGPEATLLELCWVHCV